ncbi:MAG TPA: hypothetical protein VGC67_12590 [Cellulomonas sp.]
MIRELRPAASTTLLSTHIITEVADLFDEVALLWDGHVVRHGTVAALGADGGLDLHLVRLGHPDYVWTLGIDTEFRGFSQYATVLPLAIRPPEGTASPATTLLPVTLAVNAGVLALAAALWWPLRRMRINLP